MVLDRASFQRLCRARDLLADVTGEPVTVGSE
jgi:hypothetical protein